MSQESLLDHFRQAGLAASDIHIGPEHPAIEQQAIGLLAGRPRKRVLEIGYQSGAFAVPVILAHGHDAAFDYTGIDSMAFNASIGSKWTPDIVRDYLVSRGIPASRFRFLLGDAAVFLRDAAESFDLILIDHLKALYARELRTILKRRLIRPDGVILLHDVSRRARQAWADCGRWCHCYQCEAEIDETVTSGLAVVRSAQGFKSRGWLAEAGARMGEMAVTAGRLARLGIRRLRA